MLAHILSLPEAEKKTLVEFLRQFVTENRWTTIDQSLAGRTRHLTVVLENIYQPHNASAVLRTCDCFGIQDVHIIEAAHEYRVNKEVALGAAQWLTLHRYGDDRVDNTVTCLTRLKQAGYEVAAMTLREDSLPLPDLAVDRPLALCFGTEEEGLSRTAHALADHAVTIPMAGFTQSLNVSVSVGIVLYTLTRALRTQAVDWQLPPTARTDLTLTWLIGSATGAESLVRHFLRDRQLPLPEESGGLSES